MPDHSVRQIELRFPLGFFVLYLFLESERQGMFFVAEWIEFPSLRYSKGGNFGAMPWQRYSLIKAVFPFTEKQVMSSRDAQPYARNGGHRRDDIPSFYRKKNLSNMNSIHLLARYSIEACDAHRVMTTNSQQ